MKNQNLNTENNRIHIHQEENEITSFQKKEKVHKAKKMPYLLIMLLVWIGLMLLSLCIIVPYDQWDFSLAWIMDKASDNIKQLYEYLLGRSAASGINTKLWQFLGASIVGAGLAACGATFQGSFRNVLAGPSSMGVMSGGTLGCTLYMIFAASSVSSAATTAVTNYASSNLWQQYQSEFCVLAGCFGGVLLVVGVATIAGKGKLSSSAMIICGMVFSTIVSSITMVVQYYILLTDEDASTTIESIQDMMMGNLALLSNPQIVGMMGIPIIVCLVVLILISSKLNLLSFGDEEARTMGLNVNRYRNIMIVLGTVMTAMVVSFCGRIGFLGFMVPLVARKIAGPNMKQLIPASILTGMILMVVIYDIAYIIGMTDSINVITSAIGCFVMVAVLMRKKGERVNAANQARGSQGIRI